MNCHSQIFSNSPFLEPVRASFQTGRSLEWTRVHDLPDFVYFNHSIHVAKGVGCSTCHGRVDLMPLMYQTQTLQMEWCLDCHRNPERYVRPREAVFQMDYQPPANQLELGRRLVTEYQMRRADRLLDVPPVAAGPVRRAALNAAAASETRRHGTGMNERTPLELDQVRARLRSARGRSTGAASRSWPTRPSSRSCCIASSRKAPPNSPTRWAGARSCG